MSAPPLISIVTPSFNQGVYLAETLQSLVAQDYPALEVIIQDGGSTDNSVAIAQDFARRHPRVFQVYSEKDKGQAHALNLGFAKTRGEIMGFLNSDDTLYPGCLQAVAREIDPARGRSIVFGRCLFTGEGSPYVGVEHPAEYISHFEQLAIWKRGFNTLPQPSVFWHREVWQRCGQLNEEDGHVLDYDLFCRFSAQFRFHRVDELWSTYRMHAVSKSAQRTEPEILALSTAASRRHWGSRLSPFRWRLAVSHWFYQRQAHERALHHARRAEQAFGEKRRAAALVEFLRTAALAPRLAWQRLLHPMLADSGLTWLQALIWRDGPVTSGFLGRHADGWIGPLYRETLTVPKTAAEICVHVVHSPPTEWKVLGIRAELWLNGVLVDEREVSSPGPFQLTGSCRGLHNQVCFLELRIQPGFVPRLLTGAPDDRRLCAQLIEVNFAGSTAAASP